MPNIPAGTLLSVNAYKIMFISCCGDQASAQGYFQGCGELCASDTTVANKYLQALCSAMGKPQTLQRLGLGNWSPKERQEN